MSRVSRRAFLSTAGAVTGAAALGAAVAGPKLAATAADLTARSSPASMPDGPVVAVVRNPAAGDLSLVVGDREVAVHDAALVRRLVDAAG
jgi:hypothetical protein